MTAERKPGRPYFDPDGAVVLERALEMEQRNDSARARPGAYGSTPGVTRVVDSSRQPTYQGDEIRAAVVHMAERINGLRLLFGDAVATAIVGRDEPRMNIHMSTDRLTAIAPHLDELERMLGNAYRSGDEAREEVGRLEGELARAQGSYDLQRRQADLASRHAVSQGYQTAWASAYIEFLEARWVRRLGEKSLAVLRRVGRKHATATTPHEYQPGEDGSCTWCGDGGMVAHHVIDAELAE